jgi:hypothetical protein
VKKVSSAVHELEDPEDVEKFVADNFKVKSPSVVYFGEKGTTGKFFLHSIFFSFWLTLVFPKQSIKCF